MTETVDLRTYVQTLFLLWNIQRFCFGPLPYKSFVDIQYIIFDKTLLQGLKTIYINVYLYHPSVKEEVSKLGRFYQPTL